MKKKLLWTGTLVSSVLFLVACGPSAHIEKDKNLNLAAYHSFAWATPDKKINNNVVDENLKSAVSEKLKKDYNWEEIQGNPDVLVSYDVLVERSHRTTSSPVYSRPFMRSFYNPYNHRVYRVYYPSQFMGYDEQSTPTKEGTITITLVDAATGKAILQGWASTEILGHKLTTADANSIVNAIFKKMKSAGVTTQ